MTLVANLDGVRNAYELCFVRSPWAYFTRLPLDQQWGDGWERTPYEQHAGPPYADAAQQILTVAFDGPLLTPDTGDDARALSVNEINRGDAPWLRTQNYIGNAPVRIVAGVSLERFVELVELAGGRVFAPLGWGALGLEPVGDAEMPRKLESESPSPSRCSAVAK
ncbi:hypothetical protein [Paraburkholderia sp. UYCP14C]|uniref:hypothetical protein n=1 Tax=Paraburkholderia sp. UYCP14C TaxID=2511130 RepID=UPI0020070BE6|nr:hypothetical protein [Paraburkholderia sp. UYCP14C]